MKFLLPLLLLSCISFAKEPSNVKTQIETIFAAADGQDLTSLNKYMEYVADDVILMPHNAKTVTGKNAYRHHVQSAWQTGSTTITHQLIEFDEFADIVVARGQATGEYQPKGSTDVYGFQTKNVFIFKRTKSKELRVWQVIFNMDP